jgi:hypothetical protein
MAGMVKYPVIVFTRLRQELVHRASDAIAAVALILRWRRRACAAWMATAATESLDWMHTP